MGERIFFGWVVGEVGRGSVCVRPLYSPPQLRVPFPHRPPPYLGPSCPLCQSDKPSGELKCKRCQSGQGKVRPPGCCFLLPGQHHGRSSSQGCWGEERSERGQLFFQEKRGRDGNFDQHWAAVEQLGRWYREVWFNKNSSHYQRDPPNTETKKTEGPGSSILFICAQTSNTPRPTFRRFLASTSAPRASAALTKGPSDPFLPMLYDQHLLTFYFSIFFSPKSFLRFSFASINF